MSEMIGRFQFNGIESDIFKLICKSVKRPLLPAVKTKRVELPGSSGVYDYPAHDYGLRSIAMRIVYLGNDYNELRSRARDIAAWLSTPTWGKLIIHDEPDKYYLAKITEEIDLRTIWELGAVDVVFDAQPFAYAAAEETVPIALSVPRSFNFVCPGNRVINYRSPIGSKSVIEIIGSWTELSLTLNGKTINYTQGVSGMTTIFDNIQMECTVNGENRFYTLTGDIDTFLEIFPGANVLQIGGNFGDIPITGSLKYIPMWI